MRLKIFTLIILAILAESCHQKDQFIIEIDSSNARIVEIPALSDWTGCKYSDFATAVNYIPLEITPSSLVGNVDELQITNSGEMIVFDKSQKHIMRFAPDGKYMNSIGEIGRGPNELIDPYHIAYDGFRNQLLVWDNAKSEIFFFSLDGKITKHIKTGTAYSTMGIVDQNHYCVYSNFQERRNKNKEHYNYQVLDNEGNLKYKCENFNADISFIPDCTNVFQSYNGHLYGKSPHSNIIYEFNPDSMTPLFVLKYKDAGKWDMNHGHQDLHKDACKKALLSDNYLICKIGDNTNEGLTILELKQNKMYCAFNLENDLESFGNSMYNPQCINGNKLYGQVNGFQFLVEWMENINESNHPQYEINKRFAQYENPILQVITLK